MENRVQSDTSCVTLGLYLERFGGGVLRNGVKHNAGSLRIEPFEGRRWRFAADAV
jgi:hypothetical protein